MTARPSGAAEEGAEDTLFDDPEELVGEVLPGLVRRDPPTTSSYAVVALVRQHAIDEPHTIRAFIAETAARLAEESGCQHQEPLVTWREDPEGARTCGQFQAQVVGRVDLQASTHATAVPAVAVTEKGGMYTLPYVLCS